MANINRQAPPPWGDDLEQAMAEQYLAAQRARQAPAPVLKRRVTAGRILKYCVAAVTLAAILYTTFD